MTVQLSAAALPLSSQVAELTQHAKDIQILRARRKKKISDVVAFFPLMSCEMMSRGTLDGN